MICTCGSKAVGSDRHSTWCDIDKVVVFAIDELVTAAKATPGITVLYLVGKMKSIDAISEKVSQNYFADWRYSTRFAPNHTSYEFANTSKVHVLSDYEFYNFNIKFDGIFIEDTNDTSYVLKTVKEKAPGAWVEFVDTFTEKVLETT